MKKLIDSFKKNNQDILFITFALLAMGIGIHQGVKGFKLIMAGDPVGAWAIMILVGCGIFFMDMKLKKEKETHNRPAQIFRIMAAYTLLALINFAGNFNAFFTGSLRERIVKEELNRMQKDLNEISTKTVALLEQKNDTATLIRKVSNDLSNLQAELKDPGNIGFGPDAETILNEIAKNLGVASFQVPSNVDANNLIQVSADLSLRIKQRLSAVLAERRSNGVNQNIQKVTQKTDQCLSQISTALSTLNTDEDDKLALLASIAHFNATLGILRTETTNPPFSEATDPLTEMGKVYYTLEKASSGHYNAAVWFALILSLIIDFIVPFVFLVVLGSKELMYKEKYEELTKKQEEQDKAIVRYRKTITDLREKVQKALSS